MIQDLDDSIKNLLLTKVPFDPLAIDITFAMPTKEWATGITKPTVDLYLYDIRENRELRSNERRLARGAGTAVETRSPVRVDLTYMISVWTADISDEHQLLGSLLATLLRYPVLPDEVLKGMMKNQPFPLQAWIALGERTPNIWDFWGGFDGRMKAGISYMVTLAVSPFEPEIVGLVTQKGFMFKEGD